MSRRSDKVETGVHAHIKFGSSLRLLFLTHERLVLVILFAHNRSGVGYTTRASRLATYNKVDNGSPRVLVVDIVSKSRRVDHGQLDLELLLFQLGLDNV